MISDTESPSVCESEHLSSILHNTGPLDQSQGYAVLKQLAGSVDDLSSMFEQQADRGQQLTCQAAGMTLDYSKQRIDNRILDALVGLAEERDLKTRIRQLLSGAPVNLSEQRAALHTALRSPLEIPEGIAAPDDQKILPQIHQQLEKMSELVDKIQSGVWRGFTGRKITDVVNLGVGGSDLGPLMVTHALREYAEAEQPLNVHFASTIDGSQLFELLSHLNAETTLFIVSSKSFTTIDTLSNADTVRAWLRQFCQNDALMYRCHFIGVSASADKMTQWGIPPENQLHFWSWVGGRFSLWCAIGFPIALALGMDAFRALLRGAHAMDRHFSEAPFRENIPVLMALCGVWNVNFLKIHAHAILPYDGRLKYFPSYLEQLEMESNGKSVLQNGEPITYDTCPVLWGEVGANAQHAFYQLLHQGTHAVASDFILAARRYDSIRGSAHYDSMVSQHELNIANCLAQSRVLAFGNQAVAPSDNPYRHYPGNQPSSTLLLDRLDAESLGALIAAYEHKVYAQAVIWGINPFDQWGVELGKLVALELQPALNIQPSDDRTLDSSTLGLAELIQKVRTS